MLKFINITNLKLFLLHYKCSTFLPFFHFSSMGSFRGKKNSSTLGINKTSESPPPLRKDFITYNKESEDKYASYNPHFRNTLNADTFERNTVYRSSLQNMSNAPNDLTFNRSNRYRNTIQNGSSLQHISTLRHDGRYMYPSSITSTPKSRYLTDYTPRMTPGLVNYNYLEFPLMS